MVLGLSAANHWISSMASVIKRLSDAVGYHSQQQFLGDALLYPATVGQAQCLDNGVRVDDRHAASLSGSTTRNATTSKSPLPANSPFMACVPPGVNRLATARSSCLPATDATAAASSRHGACLRPFGGLVEPRAGTFIRSFAPQRKALEAVQDAFGLG